MKTTVGLELLWYFSALQVFLFLAVGLFNGSNNSSGLAASIFFAFCGLFVYRNPDVGELTPASSWIDGLFWIVVGISIIMLVVIFEPATFAVRGNGIVISIFLIAIGVYQLIAPQKQ